VAEVKVFPRVEVGAYLYSPVKWASDVRAESGRWLVSLCDGEFRGSVDLICESQQTAEKLADRIVAGLVVVRFNGVEIFNRG